MGNYKYGNRMTRPKGETLLDKWLKEQRLSRDGFADRLGVARRTVTFWALNKVLPDIINAFRIDQATEGAVPVSSWLGTPLGMKKFSNFAEAAKKRKTH